MFIILVDEISNNISVLNVIFKECKYTCYNSNKVLLNYNNIVSYKKINILLPIFLTTALILGPTAVSSNVFAQGGSNTLGQGINQANLNKQFASCIGAGSISAACNQANQQSNLNTGSNIGGQGSGGGAGSGGTNGLGQGINQANTESQFAQCVTGGTLSDSCKGPNAQCVSGKGLQVSCDQEAFNKQIGMGKTATANLPK